MVKLEFTFFVGYVDNKIWDTDLADKWGYVPISKDLIEAAKNIVYEKGVRIAIITPKNREIKLPNDYLLQGNLVRINPLLEKRHWGRFLVKARPVLMWGAEIELHSETEEGLTKLIKDLKFPDK